MAIDEVQYHVAENGLSQIHTWGGGGYTQVNQTNTRFDLDFDGITVFSFGHHVRTGGGHDIINFMSSSEVGNVVVGRIEDFDYSRDEIRINGVILDLYDLPSNARIVEWNGDHNDSGADPQQWLLIDTGPGYIFYALEGARVDMNFNGGSNDGDQETHFADGIPNLSALPTVSFVDPQNFVPEGFSVIDGGIVINDYDHNRDDVLEVISGSSGGDLIAAGLNNDRVESAAGDDRIWGGVG